MAERYSYATYRTYRDLAPAEWRNKTRLNSTFMGTCTGLSKMPYIRDGRRSLGLDDFLMTLNNTRSLLDAPDCAAVVGHGTDIWGHRMMMRPVDNSQPGVAKCASGDEICESYPQYMRDSPAGGCGNTCAPLRAMTNKKVSNLWLGGYTMAQTMLVNSALRMHPEEFSIGVGAGAAAAHMALSKGQVLSTEQAVKTPSIVSAIRARILKHAPLSHHSHPPPARKWPKAVGFVCGKPLARCVQVPGGGAFNRNTTKPSCATTGCEPLAENEWLAVAGSFTIKAGALHTLTFKSSTRIKKSTINSSLQPPKDVVAVGKGTSVQLLAGVSERYKVDQYTYVLLRCAEPRCVA